MTVSENLYADLEDLTTRKRRVEAALRALEEEHASKLEELCERIKAGGTTGDPIRDYVVSVYHKADPRAEETFRSLERRLAGRKGEFALIEYEREEAHVWRKHYFCGQLAADRFFVRQASDRTRIFLPIKRYYPQPDYEHPLEAEPVRFVYGEFAAFLHEAPVGNALQMYTSNLILGDEAVGAWLIKHAEITLREVAEALGAVVLEPLR